MIPIPEIAELLVSTLICFAIGALWLSPALFGKTWIRLMNISADEYSQHITGRFFFWFAVFLVVINIGIHALVSLLRFTTMSDGIYFGIGMWLLFALPLLGILMLFERRPLRLFAIYSSYFLIIFIISSALYAMWR